MHPKFPLLGAFCLALSLPLPAAEIVLEQSAVESLVKQALFTDKGRYFLQRGPCYAVLETPTVQVMGGRITIRAHLSSKFGVVSGSECLGAAFATWLRVSGEPEVRSNGVLGLRNIRVHDVQDETVRRLLEGTLAGAFPPAIQFDVAAAAKRMLEGVTSDWKASVDSLTFDSVSAENGRLIVKFDFRLMAR